MTSDRIKEIQQTTAYPDSLSVKQALLQVWNECAQEKDKIQITNMLFEAANWQDNLTKRQRTEITFHQAKIEKIQEIYDKYYL